ncbi:MAG TPA: CPBP family intramembrane glutamic endopeptidase [Anaerolineales bacterium]|nr:CPBP family intramembrane glutamic endopeptidase [Anaerolineales bacterium]
MTVSNQPIELDAPKAGNSSRRAVMFILIGCAMLFSILNFGVTRLAESLDQTWAALIVTAFMLIVALVLQRVFFKQDVTRGLRALGFGRPNPRAILVAAIIAAIMVAFFPIFSLSTGAQISLRSDWLWVLLAIVVFNGIGEETLFRGFVFGGLRKEAGLSFRRAGLISMVIFAAVHLLLFIGNPFFVGFLGTLVALASAFPMAYLFERGNNTIWAPVVLHVGTHMIRLVDISELHYFLAVGIWLAIQIGMVFLVYAFLGNLLNTRE